MATLSQIAVHPIKALDPVSVERVRLTDIGGLAGDRAYVVVDGDGDPVNGKRTADVHRLRADVDLDARRVTLRPEGVTGSEQFHLDDERGALSAWLSEYFGYRVSVERGPGGFRTDSVVYGESDRPGPTLVSAATLREVASWYDGVDATEMRLRLRPNLVVSDVPAFWEDRLVAGDDRAVRVGDVCLPAVQAMPRCVVPTRDPHTGAVTNGFRETFLARREATRPGWLDPAALGGDLFRATVLLRVPDAERGGELRIGDDVRLLDADDRRRTSPADGEGHTSPADEP